MTVSIDDQIKSVRRELGMRERVYPRRVADGKMTTTQAAHETAAMQGVLATLERVASGERLI